MVLARSVIEDYLRQPRDSFSWVKELTHREVDDMLWDLRPRPREAVFGMMLHQKVCFVLGVAYPEFLFWLDMGTGKTLLTLELLNYFYQCNKLNRAVVLSPGESSIYGWEKQVKRWGIPLDFVSLPNGATSEKWALLAQDKSPLIFASYPGLMRMGTEKVAKKRGKGFRLKPDLDKIKVLVKDVQGFVLDESTKVANHDTNIHQVCRRIADRTDIRYGLAGRPFGRDPTPLWGQYRLVDLGATLGPTLELFRESMFSKKKNRFGGPYSFDYTFKDSMRPTLARIMDHRSITYSIHECVDLPPLVRNPPRMVSFPGETEGYLQKIIAQIREARGNYQEMKNAFLRMRQISSGFLGFTDDETGEKAQVVFDDNPKLDDLMEVVESTPHDAKGIIFHEFTWSGARICKALKDAGLGYGWIYGGTKDKTHVREEFDDPDSGMQWLVLNSKLGAMSLDLPIANYELFFESPVSTIDREQAERRAWRTGQKKTTFIYDFCVRGTQDLNILAFHQEGEALFQALLRNPEKMLVPRDA